MTWTMILAHAHSSSVSRPVHAEAAAHHLADTPADLRERQPGSDGGQMATRAERRTQSLVTADLIECLIMKSRGGMSEHQAQAHLISKTAGYRRLGQHDGADALPTTLQAVLTALQDQGEGSHGAQSTGGERRAAANACLLQHGLIVTSH